MRSARLGHRPAACGLLAVVWASVATDVAGQDRVVLKRGGGQITLPGSVVDFNAEQLTLRLKPGSEPQLYPTAEVVEVRTQHTAAHTRGLDQLAAGRIDDAAASFTQARSQEPRGWVRRDLDALLVRCHLRRGDLASAGSRFLGIVASESRTRHFRLIPLVWSPEPIAPAARDTARVWLAGEDDVSRLLGASLLFDDAAYGRLAEASLRSLATSSDLRLRSLAQAQGWRTQLRSTKISRLELARWETRIGAMPEELRAGPYFLLGRGHAIGQDHDRAAAAFLWLPLVYDHDHRLTARSCLEAAEALRRIGRADEADTLYREVASRFADTTFAQDAQARLEPQRGRTTTDSPDR